MKKVYLLQTLLFFSCFLPFVNIQAEGTKEVMPNNTNGTALTTITQVSAGSYFGCPVDNRIYFRVTSTAERLYFGANWRTYATGTAANPVLNNTSMYYKIFNPAGTVVSGPTAFLSTPTTSNGFITSYTQAINGPRVGTSNATGYTPITFTPATTGDFYIEMYRSADAGATQIANSNSMSPWFDFTVALPSGGGIISYPGRVFCNKWSFVSYETTNFNGSTATSSEAVTYCYTADSVTVKLDLEAGFRPLAFTIAMNSYGVANSSNWAVDRQSVTSGATAPALTGNYKTFLNTPDAAQFPATTVPSAPVFASPPIIGCPPSGPYKIRYTLAQPGDVYLLFDLNGTAGYQLSSSDRVIELINSTAGLNTYNWDGKDGLGATVTNGASVSLKLDLKKGRINVPLYDAEMNINGIRMSAMSPQNTPNLNLFWNDANVTATAATVCAVAGDNSNMAVVGGLDNTLLGQVSPGHAWNGNANTAKAIPAPAVNNASIGQLNDATAPTAPLQCDDYGNVRTINTWTWGIEVTNNSTLLLKCISAAGTIWGDANNSAAGTLSNINTAGEAGTNGGGTVYANLIDPVTGTVIASVLVNSDGTYAIPSTPVDGTNLEFRLTTTAGTVGSAPPAAALPAGYMTTSPLTQTFNTTNVDVFNKDFGIQQLPVANGSSLPNQSNPGGTTNTPVPSTFFTGNDPDVTGKIASYKFTAFPSSNVTSITINGTTYTSATFPVGGVTIAANPDGTLPTGMVSVDPIDGLVTVNIPFTVIDIAGTQDATPANVSVTYSSVLPVRFISFTGKRNKDGVVLNWSTTLQENSKNFNVEKSTNGINWQLIDVIQVDKTTGASVKNYTSKDNKNYASANYYRIKQIDDDGSFVYSSILKLSTSVTKENMVKFSPNPVRNNLLVELETAIEENKTIIVTNTFGAKVKTYDWKTVNGANQYYIRDMESLSAGMYYLIIKDAKGKIIATSKFIKE